MKGDNCSRHQNKIAIGYYWGVGYGLNGCVECMKGYKEGVNCRYYEVGK
tara:strand:- start:401 stop:547 length:147 start_codon:yes stop_codon:yes gene_type:complete